MHRRDIFKLSAAAAAGSLAQAAPAQKPSGKKVLMKIGTQNGHTDEMLTTFAAFGVNNICSGLPSNKIDSNWSRRTSRRCERKWRAMASSSK